MTQSEESNNSGTQKIYKKEQRKKISVASESNIKRNKLEINKKKAMEKNEEKYINRYFKK